MRDSSEGMRFEPPQLDKKEEEEASEDESWLTGEEMREKFHDPSFLPSYENLSQLLKGVGDADSYGHPVQKKWEALVYDKKNPIFEIWTKEYVHAFGSYLAQRVAELGGTKENPTVILEVGAGNGRLTHFLQDKMDELIPGKVKIIASDSGDWQIPPAFPVENISHSEALEKFKPQIVIFSWMPYEYDCTSDFRATKSVDEYILIGESSGCCGDGWKTWGDKYTPDEEEARKRENQPAPFEADGFEQIRHDDDLGCFQLSRTNIKDGKSAASTVSFRRKK